MSYLNKLLESVEVESKTIDDLFHIKNGYTPSKSNQEYWTDGTIPWFRMEDIRSSGRVLSDSIQHVSGSAVKGKLIPKNSLLMSTTATIGEHALILVPYLSNQQITNFSLKTSFKDKVSIKYLFYCFFDFGKWCRENANKNGGLGIIGINKLKEYTIPIPCPVDPQKSLEIQTEIVRILDTFTERTETLINELTTELEARKKQYNYYREKLLSFKEGEVEWKNLGELFEFKNGINKGKEFFGRGESIINYTDVFKNKKLFENSLNGKVVTNCSDIERFNCKKGDVFFTRTSETQNEIGYASVLLSDIKICVFSGFLIRARPITGLLLPEYCAYCFFSNHIRNEIISASNMTTRVTTTGTALSKIKIPIPSLDEQARIVSILDKLESLTASISEALPKEIALRKKQYEYYRDRLLNFPKNE